MADSSHRERRPHRREPAPTPSTWRWRSGRNLAILLLISFTTILYFNSFTASFVFDDDLGIKQNPTLTSLKRSVLDSGAPPRPVLMLSFALNRRWGGLDPTGYHVTNYVIHLLNTLLVYVLLGLLLSQIRGRDQLMGAETGAIALWSAMIFAGHPVQTESIAYVWGRSGALCTTFYLLSLWLFARCFLAGAPTKGRRAFIFSLSLVCFALALGTKATALTLVPLLLLVDFYFIANGALDRLRQRLMPYHACFMVFAVVRLLLHLPRDGGESATTFISTRVWPEGLNAVTNVLTQCHLFIRYLFILVFPFRLNADHDLLVIQSPLDPTFLLAVIFLAMLLIMVKVVHGRSPVFTFGLLWFFITLSFFMLVPLADLLVERRLYLPSIGFSICMTALIIGTARQLFPPATGPTTGRRDPARILWTVVLIAIVAVNGWTTVRRNAVWQNDYALWHDTVQKSPHKIRPHINLAAKCFALGHTDESIVEWSTVLEMEPSNGPARIGLIGAYMRLGTQEGEIELTRRAIAEFARALRYAPEAAARWYLDALTHVRLEPFEAVALDFERVLAGGSGSGDQHIALGLILLTSPTHADRARDHLELGRNRGPTRFDIAAIDRMIRQIRPH